MVSIRELRSRIRGVKNIAQITRAMEMVASTKLKRLQERAEGTKPYSESLRSMVGRLAGQVSSDEFPLLQAHDEGAVAVLTIAGDKGLCGAYNSNVFRASQQFARGRSEEVKHFIFGARGRSFFKVNAPKITEGFPDVLEKIPFVRVRDTVQALSRMFEQGELKELHLTSTRFLSAGSQKPEVRQLLPIDAQTLLGAGAEVDGVEPLLEPSAEAIFSRLLPKYLQVQVYGAILEALASEFAMRRAAMKAATDAANDMIGELTRKYNRARQETITKELLEIVGGAEALKG